MSTSLLAFLTLLEKRVRPLLSPEKTWRFQRIVDFRAREATLQLWDELGGTQGSTLSGQVTLRETRQEDGTPSFNGSMQSEAAGDTPRKFSFHAHSDAEVERQAQRLAETWSVPKPVDGQ